MATSNLRPESSRKRTRQTGVFVRDTPGSRSLSRGLAILRAFRPGTSVLTNAEIAAHTGLPRSTVSRLTSSLVDAGFLDFDIGQSAYRLGPPFLGFGEAVRQGSVVLETALPLMREVAEGLRINVGLAVADDVDMIYLESVRKSRLGVFRHVFPGSRVPIAETALGRAWLAGSDPDVAGRLLEELAARYGERWPRLHREVERSIALVGRQGYCGVAWRTGLVSIATPLVAAGQRTHAFNISFPAAPEQQRELEARYAPLLLGTRDRIVQTLAQREAAGRR